MTDAELENRFSYHAPFGDQIERCGEIRAGALVLAKLIRDKCPDSRERATALTHLDAVMFYGNAAVARNEVPPAPPEPPANPWKVGDRVRFYDPAQALPPGTVVVVQSDRAGVRWDGWSVSVVYPPGKLVPEPNS